ncbi:MAG: bifunctional 5,10-methylenetetrahydrofolate dehydrogenase/5,10-methenyltetrahydrofolate cyclohydrolase [Armatimonadota bacterium]|nr:bifunctional 5,10-methylenetetrahydrofolate dehydrogenase/5,10-methenyltetrahydrofolate cyclohydrolase [Armatimonadota bacterium]
MSTAEIIDGVAIAEDLKAELRAQVAALRARGVVPGLVTVQVGDDPGARVYRRQVERVAAEVGIAYRDVTLPAEVSLDDVRAWLRALAADPTVHGVLPLRPLPPALPEAEVFLALDPAKDVDGLHPLNAGRLALGQPAVVPATPLACFVLLDRYFARRGLDPRTAFAGKDLVIVGRSPSVGRPAYFLALERHATPTTVHSFTSRAGRLEEHTRRAEILIVAAGRAEFIRGPMVRPGAVVVDVGINVRPVTDADGRPVLDERGRPRRETVGDVAFAEVSRVAAAITPVPGGVGAVTNVVLMRNVVDAAARLAGA